MSLSPEQQAALNRCQRAYEDPPDLPAQLFDSLAECRIERCGIDSDCDGCKEKHCPCENWEEETEEEDYDD